MMRFAMMVCAAATLGGCGPISFTLGSSPADRKIESSVVQDAGGFVSDRVAIIDVTGLITNSSSKGFLSESDNPVGLLHEKLEEARTDSRVKAIILRLNTPGGTVTASDAMYREVKRFREMSGKPVVAMMMDVTASGGYYLSCAADEIVAYPTTITGSIGVIMQTVSFKPVMDKIGISADAITSGPNKAAGSPLESLKPEQRALFQQIVDDFYGRFKGIVKDSRPKIPADQWAIVTDGRVFTGTEAAKLGLVDDVGDLYDAFAVAKKRAGIERANLVLYHREGDMHGSAYAEAPNIPTGTTQINLAQINVQAMGETSSGAFWYLWQAGGP